MRSVISLGILKYLLMQTLDNMQALDTENLKKETLKQKKSNWKRQI